MITFLAPPERCLAASARAVQKAVDSITTPAPRSHQGRSAGSRSERTLSSSPSTEIASPLTATSPGKRPRIESYLSRLASVATSVRAFTATKSMSAPAALAARTAWRPIRPKPLMPTFTAIESKPSWSRVYCRTWSSVAAHRYLDLRPVGVLEERRVGAGAVRGALAPLARVGAARVGPRLPGRLDGDN